MEVALADVSEALDAIEAGMGGRDPEEAAAAAARLPSHAALLRRNLDLFVGASVATHRRNTWTPSAGTRPCERAPCSSAASTRS